MESSLLSEVSEDVKPKIRREVDSLDDFEHLDEINPRAVGSAATGGVSGDLIDTTTPAVAHEPNMGDELIETFQKSEDIYNGLTNATQTLLDYERNFMQEPTKLIPASFNDLADKFTDSDPDLDDDHMYEDKAKFASADDLLRADSPTASPAPAVDHFKDVIHEDEDVEPDESVLVPADKGITIEEFVIERNEPVREYLPEEDHTPENSSPIKQVEVSKVSTPPPTTTKISKPEVGIMQAEEMFLKMGLDTWFNPERLHPTVESLIYWRDPKKSGCVFGSILVVLLSLAYFSLISVTAYLSLTVLLAAISFRIYKTVMQAVQKTSDGHPFKEILELDLTLPQDKVQEITELLVTHINGGVNELRRLFLVEDFIDSIKFAVTLWCLTYLGAWFNGMTLIIIGFVALFTLPKVYETNKTQIDANLDIVRTKLAEITSKVKAAVPIGKKSEEKKE